MSRAIETGSESCVILEIKPCDKTGTCVRVHNIARSMPHLNIFPIPQIHPANNPSTSNKAVIISGDLESPENEVMTVMMSAFYAKFLVVLGIALPITDAIRKKSPGSYDAFYMYLYLGSTTFFGYLYLIHLRDKSLPEQLQDKRKYSLKKQQSHHRTPHFGSFYLHLGVAGFGMGSIVFSCLQFGHYFELTEPCADLMMAFTPLCKVAFIIQQMVFLFSESHVINAPKYAVQLRFGLMHLIATNICVWLAVIIEDTKIDILDSSHKSHLREFADNEENSSSINGDFQQNFFDHMLKPEDSEVNKCFSSNVLKMLTKNASVYLSPCDVEYSLLCAIIITVLWKNLSSSLIYSKHISDTPDIGMDDLQTATHIHPHSQFYLDCAKAQKGLFFGLLLLSGTAISLILFFELVNLSEYSEVAILQVNIWETILFASGTFTAISCIMKLQNIGLRDLRHHLDLEHVLLLFTQAGVYLYSMFQVIGCIFLIDEHSERSKFMRVLAPCCAVVQSSCQTILILDAWRRRCGTSQEDQAKPGRQLITFLLAVNISLWVINRAKNNRAAFHSFQLEFYGVWAWTVITHISMPLVVCYRFQSTVCFYEIWKHMYKPAKSENFFANI